MKIGSLFSLLGIGLITVVGVGYLTFGVVRYDPTAAPLTATLIVPNSAGLQNGSPILLRGVEVGEVTEVRRERTRVLARFTIEEGRRIPVDSDVYIEALSGLGEPYVVFTPTTMAGPILRGGQTVQGTRVHTPLSIPEVARVVVAALEQLDPAVIDRLLDTTETALAGTTASVPRMARAGDLVAAMLTSRSATIATMLADLQRTAADMAWTGPALSESAPVFAEFAVRFDEIATAVERIINTGDTPAMYVEGRGLVPFLDLLDDWIEKIGPEVKPLVPVLQPLAAAAAATLPQTDLGALIASAAAATAPGGALHLRIDTE